MANEITVVGVDGRNIQLMFLFPVAAPAEDSDGTPVAPTPSSGLPAVAAAKLTQGEQESLDAGTSIFQTYTMYAEPGMLPAEILAKAQANYAAVLAKRTAQYLNTYQFLARVGERFDAV